MVERRRIPWLPEVHDDGVPDGHQRDRVLADTLVGRPFQGRQAGLKAPPYGYRIEWTLSLPPKKSPKAASRSSPSCARSSSVRTKPLTRCSLRCLRAAT